MKFSLPAVLSALWLLASAACAGDGVRLSHQGVVAVRGERFTGNGQFRFALVNADTGSCVWTNDGSPVVAPNAPTEPVVLTVVNGVFGVTLGDTALENMTPIPESILHRHESLRLRVWFDDASANGLHQLTPDVEITDAARSVHAIAAARLNIPGRDATAVHVDALGRVGVGTAMPEAELHVDGNAIIDGDAIIAGNATIVGEITADGPVTSLNGGFRFPDGSVLMTGIPERGVRGFSTTGTFVVPPGVHFLLVELWSGGGGGGGGGGGLTSIPVPGGAGAGGGAGGYARAFVSVEPGDTYDIVVGLGGTMGNPGPANSPGGMGGMGGASFIRLSPGGMTLLSIGGGAGGGPGLTQGVNGAPGVGGGTAFDPATGALTYLGGSGTAGNGAVSAGTGGTLISYSNPPIRGTSAGGNGSAGGAAPFNFGGPGQPGQPGFTIIHWW